HRGGYRRRGGPDPAALGHPAVGRPRARVHRRPGRDDSLAGRLGRRGGELRGLRSCGRVSAPPRRGALSVASSVLGAGALFLPTLAAGQEGSAAAFAWAWQCALGVLLVATIGALAQATGEVGIAGFAAAALGARWKRPVTACYLVGFLAGQAVIAAVAGTYLADAMGGGRAAAY